MSPVRSISPIRGNEAASPLRSKLFACVAGVRIRSLRALRLEPGTLTGAFGALEPGNLTTPMILGPFAGDFAITRAVVFVRAMVCDLWWNWVVYIH